MQLIAGAFVLGLGLGYFLRSAIAANREINDVLRKIEEGDDGW